MPSWSFSGRAPWAHAGRSSVNRVAASLHASGEGPVVVPASLGQGVLLLRHVALLLLPLLLLHLLLLLHVSPAPHHAEEPSYAGTDGCALSGVTSDRAAH